MTAWTPSAGGTLFIASGPSGDHLFVVVYDPRRIDGRGKSDQLLIIPFCSVESNANHDPACLVQQGEHSFISHESYMDYRNARVEPVSHVASLVGSGTFSVHDPVSENLLNKIRQGCGVSKRIPRHIKDDFHL